MKNYIRMKIWFLKTLIKPEIISNVHGKKCYWMLGVVVVDANSNKKKS